MTEFKMLTQCKTCHISTTCGLKKLAAEAVELLTGDYSFLSVSCDHFTGDEKTLELPAFLKNKKGA